MRHGPQSLYLVDCSIRERLSDKVITLGFGGLGGASIEVPLRDLIFTVPKCGEEDGLVTYGETGHHLMDTHCACYLAINRSPMALSPNTAEITILGDAFVRHAYVVYDLENNIIGMAPRNFDSDTTNIVEFRKGMMSLPNSSKAPDKSRWLRQDGPNSHASTLQVSNALVVAFAMLTLAIASGAFMQI